MRKQKRKQQSEPIYGLDSLPLRLIRWTQLPLFLLTIVIFGKIALILLNQRAIICCFLCPSPFIFYFAFVLWRNLDNISDKHLTIDDEGIHMQLLGVICFAHWDNLDYFGWKWWNNELHWGIVVDKPITEFRGTFSKILPDADKLDTFIPLDYFAKIPRISDTQIDLERFKKTPLGRDLYYYAPHLFDEAEAKSKH